MDVLEALRPYAKVVDEALLTSLGDVEPPTLREAAFHYPAAGGKRLRPVMALLACEAAGGRREEAVPFAVAVELVHNFSLVHDDIMDRDLLRRGRPTVHANWGEPTAILAGDAMLAKAFEAVAEGPGTSDARVRAVLDLATTTRVLCEGQALDMEFEAREDVGVDDYLHMIASKTGRLFEVACRGGAYFAGSDAARGSDATSAGGADRHVRPLESYGAAFGEAFQIHDDLLDLTPTAKTGKPFGSDVRAGKKTLVALEAFARADAEARATIARAFGNASATDAEVEAAVAAFDACGAIGAARERVDEASRAAESALRRLPASSARETLAALARWASTRDR